MSHKRSPGTRRLSRPQPSVECQVGGDPGPTLGLLDPGADLSRPASPTTCARRWLTDGTDVRCFRAVRLSQESEGKPRRPFFLRALARFAVQLPSAHSWVVTHHLTNEQKCQATCSKWSWRKVWALSATMIVESDMSKALIAGGNTNPSGARMPAASGRAMIL